MLITEPPPSLDDFWYSVLAAKESAEYINCHTAPEFRVRCFGYRSIDISRASDIVVQNMQRAVTVDHLNYAALHAVMISHIDRGEECIAGRNYLPLRLLAGRSQWRLRD